MNKFFAHGGSGHAGAPGCTSVKTAPASCSAGSQNLQTSVQPAKGAKSSGSQKLKTSASPAKYGATV